MSLAQVEEFLLFWFILYISIYINFTLYTSDPKLIHFPLGQVSPLVKASQADPTEKLDGINKPIWRAERDKSDFYLYRSTTVNKALTGEISCPVRVFSPIIPS